MARLFGTDGIRGIVGKELNSALAWRVGNALGASIRSEVLIGMDPRASSEMLANAVAAGLIEAGCDVGIIGVCTTPAVAYLTKRRGAAAGVMISASHNPYEYNGIKIFGADGFKLPDVAEEKIEDLVLSGKKTLATGGTGKIIDVKQEKEEYLNFLKGAFGCRLDGMKIAVDCANGSTADIAKALFEGLGAKCLVIGDKPNGKNINDSCGSTSLDALKEAVLSGGCELGVAFDGDGDRCLALDGSGCIVDGDYIMSILALWLKDEGRLSGNTLVGTVMTNLGLEKFCYENGIGFKRSAVGDRYVSDMMREAGYSFGGEQSGHIIFGDIATTGDGLLTALALLSRVKSSKKSLSDLARVMKKYPQLTVNIPASKERKSLLGSSEVQSWIDEAKKRLGNGRVLVCPSGTEPLIRIMVEAESEKLAEDTAGWLAKKINGIPL